MTDERLDVTGGFRYFFEPDAALDAETVEQVDQVFGRKVARCPGRVRAPAQTAGTRIEDGDASLEAGVDVDQGGSARVVEMEGEPGDGHSARDFAQQV